MSIDQNTRKKTNKRFIALALITFVLAVATGDRATLSVAGSDMQAELGITAIQIGYLFSAFSWAYVMCMPFSGWVGDILGSKKTMFFAIGTWSIVTIFMGAETFFAAYIFPILLILRFFLGVTESPVGPVSARILASWFPSKERGIAGSIFNSAQYISIGLFTPLMAWLCYTFSWHYVFFVMGALGILVAIIWLILFYVPRRHPSVNEAEIEYIKEGGGLVDLDANTDANKSTQKTKKSASFSDIIQLFKNRMLVGIFLAQYCITAITWFFMTWFPIYLVKEQGLTILKAGFIASVPAICGFMGGILGGSFSDYLLKKTGNLSIARKIPITIGMLLSASMILCNYVDSATAVVFFMSLAFFGKAFGTLSWTVAADTAPKEIIGTTGGIFNSIGNIAGIITPVVIGYIFAATGSFKFALVYVGVHGFVAILSYWVIVGKIQRMELKR